MEIQRVQAEMKKEYLKNNRKERRSMEKAQTQEEWEEQMGFEILDYLKGEIYMDLPFMELALSALAPKGNSNLLTFATDGIWLSFGPAHLIEVFKQNTQFLERAYLHTVLHCIYAHLWIAGTRDRRLWNLSCDIAVESVIDNLNKPCTKRILGWQRQRLYQIMEKEKLVSAAEIYEYLLETKDFSIEELIPEFHVDDHRYWPETKDTQQKPQMQQENQNQKKWQKIARQMQMKKDQKGNDPDEATKVLLRNAAVNKGRKSYGDFLKKFTRRQEELHLNMEEFDLTYYTYGLEHYGNIPLVEPLETKEEQRIRELVIVIDTSYSTSGELVEGFLQETFTILKEKEAFFRNNRVHIIQCDDAVRQDIEITSETQMEALLQQFSLCGGGNTDFRPAFTYVNELVSTGKLKDPGGLLYFTDGNGIYPKKQPPYKTAFLFLGDYEKEKVPAWAMQLAIEKEELRYAGENLNPHS